MRHDREAEPEPPYDGPFCVIRPVGLTYTVAIEPLLASGEGSPRTYGSKHEAFGAARDLWTAHRLPLLDLSDAKVGPRA
jgi:hypothetical protein